MYLYINTHSNWFVYKIIRTSARGFYETFLKIAYNGKRNKAYICKVPPDSINTRYQVIFFESLYKSITHKKYTIHILINDEQLRKILDIHFVDFL